jgi:hypothetical protein
MSEFLLESAREGAPHGRTNVTDAQKCLSQKFLFDKTRVNLNDGAVRLTDIPGVRKVNGWA